MCGHRPLLHQSIRVISTKSSAGACISAVVVVLNVVVIFRKIGHLEETITIILVLKRRDMMTLCLQVILLSKQSNMQGN